MFMKFLAFVLQTYSLIEQHLKVRKCVALQMIVKWPYQTIEKAFLSLCICVDFIWCIAGQMSKLVQILTNCHVALL
jgi:hypothetical protein